MLPAIADMVESDKAGEVEARTKVADMRQRVIRIYAWTNEKSK